MAKDIKRRFTVDLEISMGDAEKKIKGTVSNIKTILADLGKASDKMTYFKELADYLSQVDAELDRFKQKHGDGLFNQLFSGLDAGLRKEMEDVFGTAREQLTQLEVIRAKFEKMKSNGATKTDLKPLEQELKDLYKSLGKLDEAKISGRGTLETRLKKMEDALDNFAAVWDGVNKKVSKGFNFDGAGSSTGTGAGSSVGGISQFSDEVQKEIDKLNKQIEELETVRGKLSKIYKIADQAQNKAKGYNAIPDDYIPELTIESINQLIEKFDSLKATLDSSDKSSTDYYNNLVKISEVALKLQKAMGALVPLNADDPLRQLFVGNGVFTKLSMYKGKTENVLKEVLGLGSAKIKPIGDMIKAHKAQINSLVSGNNETKKSNNDVSISYDALKNKVKEYIRLINQYRQTGSDKLIDDMQRLNDSIARLAKDGSSKNKIRDILTSLENLETTGKDAFESIAKTLGVTEISPELENANIKLQEFFNTAKKLKGLTSLEGIDSEAALNDLRAVRDELHQLQKQGVITEQQMRDVSNELYDVTGNLYTLGQNADSARGSGSGAGGIIANVDFTDLKDTIKSEASALASKLDNVLKVELIKDDTDIQGAINGIKATVDKISSVIDNYNSLKETSAQQAEVEIMKSNLTQLLKQVSDFNARKIDDEYQHQELSAAIMSDGTISTGFGEKGTVPWDRLASSLVGNLTKSLMVHIHSHPWGTFFNEKKYANDAFSGAQGDLGAFGFSKDLGASIAAMITGNIMRTLDLTKLTSKQMEEFRSALADVEKKYANTDEYSKYIEYDGYNDKLYYHPQRTLTNQHKVTEAFESLMYKAFERIGFSKDQVDAEIFKKYNLDDNKQLTDLAERLVGLSHASQEALAPVDRLMDIVMQFAGDVMSTQANTAFDAYEKGELSAADVFNALNGWGLRVNQDTIDSMLSIDTAHEVSSVESMLGQITGILNTISSNVASIDSNTRQSTSDKYDVAMHDILDLKNGVDNKYFTAGVKSIFDPLNISEYKSQEVLRQANESATIYTDLFHDVFRDSLDNNKVDVEMLEAVLSRFKTALANVDDAMNQINLYEARTAETIYDGPETAMNSLAETYTALTDSTNLEGLLYLLSQAKLDIGQFKSDHDSGFTSGQETLDVSDINLVIGGLSQIQSTLESIYGVLHGFTGIEANTKNALKYSEPVVDTTVASREFSEHDLSVLESILQAIRNIDGYLRTNKTDDAIEKVDQDNVQNSELLNFIRSKLPQQLASEDTLQAIKSVVDSVYTNLSQAEIKPETDNTSDEQSQEPSVYQLLASKLPQNVASEDTLSSIRDILGQLVDVVKTNDEAAKKDDESNVKESLGQLVSSLTLAVKGLQDVTNGIVKDRQVRKTDTSVANARIADKKEYAQLRDVALNSLGDRAIDSEVTEMKALANGIVQVIGYLQVAENEWEGFTVQINEANEASKLAFDKNSKAAKRAAAEAEALRKLSEQKTDDNQKAYSKEETARRAQVHLDEYTAQGKNATVQLKDSGRYTISILEEIGGLSKQIFQTFDENDEKIERTTATMSNKVLIKLQSLQKIAEFGNTMGFVGDNDDAYTKYNEAYAELERLNSLYRDQDNFTDDEIASWNTQIKLVQQLGSEVEKLVLRRKTAASNELFSSKRNAKVSAFDKDYKKLKQSIAIPDSFTDEINEKRNALNQSVDNESLQIAINNWTELRNRIEQAAIAQDLYIKKTNATKTVKKNSYGTTPVVNAQAKFNTLQERAQPYIKDGSTVVSSAMKEYEESLNNLIALQKTFKNEQDLTKEQKIQFVQLRNDCNKYADALKKVLDSSDKLQSNGTRRYRVMNDVPLDDYSDRAKALRKYVQETYRGKAAIGAFNGDATELTFTLKNTDGTIENMTASLNAARTAIISASQGTKQATSLFGGLGAKFKELWTYAAARFGVDEIIQVVRTGVQYVRDIDSALTELKKVTDETNGAYDRFLQNMSKTAGVVGSTVSDLTTMAAEWARLGYSMEESATLAKNTAILMNVSEFDDATEASEALISTMQAFQYTADESGHVVDILNEVGEYIARR